MDILTGFHNGLADVVDAFRGLAGSVLSAEIEEEHKELAKEVVKAFDGVAEKKTEQVHTIITVLLIPLAMIIGGFLLKMVYDLFTGAADKVGKGVGSISSKLKSGNGGSRASGKSSGKLPRMPVDPSKSSSRMMLLGQVIIRFVNPSLTDKDVENAVRIQKQSNNGKKIGEILVEQGVVTKDDVLRALKIQKKA